LAARRHNVNVLLSDSTFLIFAVLVVRCISLLLTALNWKFFLTFISAVILHVLIFAVDVDYIGLAFRLKHVN